MPAFLIPIATSLLKWLIAKAGAALYAFGKLKIKIWKKRSKGNKKLKDVEKIREEIAKLKKEKKPIPLELRKALDDANRRLVTNRFDN